MLSIWLLDTDDREVDLGEEVADGDFILRPHGGGYEVGRATPEDEPPVRWYGTIDEAVVPDDAADPEATRQGQARKVRHLPELEAALGEADPTGQGSGQLPARGPKPPG